MNSLFQPIYAHRSPKLTWSADEIIVDLDNQPHLLTRVEIRGRIFPLMNAEPFVRIVNRQDGILSWFANIGEDGASLSGYFATDAIVDGGGLEYGYGNRVLARIKGFAPGKIGRLDKSRLPKDLVVVTEAFIQRIQERTVRPHVGARG